MTELFSLTPTPEAPSADPAAPEDPTPPEEPVETKTAEPADVSELLTVPGIGPARAHALAEAGYPTLNALRAASAEQIGAVKGVGLHEAERVKAWLESPSAALAPPAAEALPEESVAQAPSEESVAEPTEAVEDAAPEEIISETATENQTIQDRLVTLEAAIGLIRHALPAKKTDKKLLRQFDKLIVVASDIPESMDTLKPKAAASAVKSLDKIATLLETAASYGALHPKEQETLREKLRERRKALQKALGV